jgi:lipoprotein-releasing system permease protein
MKLIIEIAKTQMLSRIKQTVIATLGVTFGIAMFILMISVMTGVNQILEETMLAAAPHIHIYNKIEVEKNSILDKINTGENFVNIVHHQKPKEDSPNLKNGFQIVEHLRKDQRVLGVSPLLTTQVFYNFGAIQIGGNLAGVEILEENKLFDLKRKLKAGSLENLFATPNGIIMGQGLAEKMKLNVGDKITVTTPKGNILLVQVVGIFKFGVGAIDDARSYTDITTVQKILQKDNRYITDINIKLKDYYQAKAIAQEYQSAYAYFAEDWETANATILVSFKIRNIMTVIVSATLLIVAGFGIYNIMNMTIYEKMREIAILKATGFAGGDVMGVFMTQSLTIGILGALSGLLIGFSFSYFISTLPFDTGGVLSLDTFPVNFDIKYYIFGILFGIITTALAGYLPSKKAAKIDPVQIIRGQ